MNEVVATDPCTVAVPCEDYCLQRGVEHLRACGEGERPPMGRVQGIASEVGARNPAAAPDPRDAEHVVDVPAEVIDGADKTVQNHAIPAARAERSEVVDYIVGFQLSKILHCVSLLSSCNMSP